MMPSLELNIAGRPLKIQCSDENIDLVKGVASKISQLIDVEKKENVSFLTSTFIAFLKSDDLTSVLTSSEKAFLNPMSITLFLLKLF